MNIGLYPIQFCQWIFQRDPRSIKVLNSRLNDDGIDVELSAVIDYGNGQVAKIQHSFLQLQSNRAKIIGTNGELIVNAILFSFILFCETLHFEVDADSFSSLFRFLIGADIFCTNDCH